MKAINYFREKKFIRDVRLGPKCTSDIQTFERKTVKFFFHYCRSLVASRVHFHIDSFFFSETDYMTLGDIFWVMVG